MNIYSISISLCLICLSQTAFAFDGAGSSGGGNIEKLARERANNPASLKFDNEFKTEVARYFEWFKKELPNLKDQRIKSVFSSMLETKNKTNTIDPSENIPAVKDVWESEYRISGEACLDFLGNRKSASSLIKQPGTSICLDQDMLDTQAPSNKELLALIVHEHVVHFHGLVDEDHEIMQWVMDSVPKFYFATSNISLSGCEDLIQREAFDTKRVVLPTYLVYVGSSTVVANKGKGPGAVVGVGILAFASKIFTSETKIKKSKKAFRVSLEMLREAKLPDPPTTGTLAELYKRLSVKSPQISPQQLSNIILEANKRATFCPLFEKPMTDKAIEAWIKIYIRDKAPL